MGSSNPKSAPKPAISLAGIVGVPRLYGDVVLDDRICPGCSFNLKGMRSGERCPECGVPIPTKAGSRHGWMMTQSPVEYLRWLARGCMWMLGSGAVLTASLLWVAVDDVLRGEFPLTAGEFAVLAAVGWVIGVVVVTMPRPQEPGNPGTRVAEWRRLRRTARVSQLAWILGAVLIVMAGWMEVQAAKAVATMPSSPPSSGTVVPVGQQELFVGGSICLGVGVIGLIPLAFYLALLADWADDAPLARKLRMTPGAFLGALVLAALMVVVRPLLHDLPLLFVLIPTLVVMAGLFLLCASHFGIALIQFVSVGIWAEQNASTALESDRRRSAKIVKRVMDAQAKAPAAPVSAPAGHKPARPQGAYVPGGPGGKTYDLAPPGDAAPGAEPTPTRAGSGGTGPAATK